MKSLNFFLVLTVFLPSLTGQTINVSFFFLPKLSFGNLSFIFTFCICQPPPTTCVLWEDIIEQFLFLKLVIIPSPLTSQFLLWKFKGMMPRPCFAKLKFWMAPHSSTLAWKITWTEKPGGLQSMGSLRVGHSWATSLSLFTFMHWRRKWQLTPVFLPRESQGWGSLMSCCLWGHTESDTTEAT